MDGQSGVATQAGRDYSRLTGNPMYELLTLIRFGRFEDVLDVAKIREKPTNDIQLGVWNFSMGYASLKSGDPVTASAMVSEIKALSKSSNARFRFHPANLLLGTLAHILEGEIHWIQGDLNQAIESFITAGTFEDQLTYDEPEPLPFAARHWLGAAYIATDDFVEAERVYREALQDHPNNGWSYYGLLQALEGQGKQDRQITDAFERSWARSDTWISASKF
jgi:tetratricopeptide (TPR) repeat protein